MKQSTKQKLLIAKKLHITFTSPYIGPWFRMSNNLRQSPFKGFQVWKERHNGLLNRNKLVTTDPLPKVSDTKFRSQFIGTNWWKFTHPYNIYTYHILLVMHFSSNLFYHTLTKLPASQVLQLASTNIKHCGVAR